MSLNRNEGKSALEKNLTGASVGFRVTGDAAIFEGSTDYAMFSEEGNLAVAAMVATLRTRISEETLSEADAYELAQELFLGVYQVHGEIADTMSRETLAYALDGIWNQTYGHDVDQYNLTRYE